MNKYEIGDHVHVESVHHHGLKAAFGLVSHIEFPDGPDPVLYIRVLAYNPKGDNSSNVEIVPPSKRGLGDVCVRSTHIVNYSLGNEPQYANEKLPTNLIEGKNEQDKR